MLSLAFGVLVVGALPLVAAEATIKGEVVDQQCFLKDKSRGADHKDCAMGCAKKGKALAIVTDAGDVYTITGSYTDNKNAKLVDFVAKTVEAKGDVTESGGQKSIAVASLAEVK
jgi:hypothetical protein